jgi:nucleotide-binding universal stress UspA family protein
MKKLLIAIDYFPCSQIIAETGFAFGMAMNAEICITHAVADISYYAVDYAPIMGFEGFSADSSYKKIDEQKKEAAHFLAAVVHHLGDQNIETQVLDGRTSKAILDFAASWKADLIVMGAQSHNSFEKILMGDVTANVLKHSEIPILVVPAVKQEPIASKPDLIEAMHNE